MQRHEHLGERAVERRIAPPRRCQIDEEEPGDYDKEALIREEYMVVTVTHDGYIKRLPPSTYRAQGRGGRGISATNTTASAANTTAPATAISAGTGTQAITIIAAAITTWETYRRRAHGPPADRRRASA